MSLIFHMARYTIQEQKQLCHNKHNNFYDYTLWPDHVLNKDKLSILCPFHGKFEQRLSDHKNGSGCPTCGKLRQTKAKKKSKSEYIKMCLDQHGQMYDYSLIKANVQRHDTVDIICPIHGEFTQLLSSHINGHGCRKCAVENVADNKKVSIDECITRCNDIHNKKYDYSLWTDDIKTQDRVQIICPIHGKFEQILNSHLQGHGCCKCKSSLMQQTIKTNYGVNHPHHRHINETSLNMLNDPVWLVDQHHNNKLPIKQIASNLNVDPTTVNSRLRQFNISIKHYFQSTGERELSQYVESLGVKVVLCDRNIIKPYELDIFIPDYNIAIEYCGLYWHSEQQGKDRNYHKNKHDMCKKQNIQLLTIFEDEWHDSKFQVQNKIANLLHKSTQQKIYGRKCTIQSVHVDDKKDFMNKHHIQQNGPGSINYGLYYNRNMVACMSFSRKDHESFYLTRYATSSKVVGGFSKLLKYFAKLHPGKVIVSFADMRWSNGNLYSKNGWKLDSVLPPDYSYSPDGKKRYHKFRYRRKFLPKLLSNFDPTLSEWENCKNNNVLRIWDCGKLRYTISTQ